jgi:hypothetical protein
MLRSGGNFGGNLPAKVLFLQQCRIFATKPAVLHDQTLNPEISTPWWKLVETRTEPEQRLRPNRSECASGIKRPPEGRPMDRARKHTS